MASHISLIREGILESSWDKVCSGFEQVTGEKLNVPEQISFTVPKEQIQNIIGKYLLNLGNNILNQEPVVENKISPVNKKGTKPVKIEKLNINTSFEDDDSIPPDNPKIYTNLVKNPTPLREHKVIVLTCEKCNKEFEIKPEHDLSSFDSSIMCEDCKSKRMSLVRSGGRP